jgi:ketosteroid isomerase-like protein
MSQENVEIARDGFAALARGDFDSFRAFLDEDVEWVNPSYAVEPGTRHGPGEFGDALGRMRASFGDVQVEIDEVMEAGDQDVVVSGHWTGKGTGSGVPMETAFSSVLTLRDGKIVRYQWFRRRAEALEAVGLSE